MANLNRRIYVDTRLHTLLDFRFNQPFFQRGDFPQIIFNGSGLAPLPICGLMDRIQRLLIRVCFFFVYHRKIINIGCNRILPYYERGCGFF